LLAATLPLVAAPAALRTPCVARLSLRDFRSYAALELATDGRLVVLTGPNGVGKTNLLEALSFLSPGRGLRRARLADAARHGAAGGWAVAATIETAHGEIAVGTGLAGVGERERRAVRLNGADAQPTALAEAFGVAWLTPQMDRLFNEGPGARRRFMDRIVFAFDCGHAARVSGYERAMRERARLLEQGGADAAWLAALEAQMVERGVAVAAARRDALARLGRALAEAPGPFPRAEVAVEGAVEGWLAEAPAVEAEARFAAALKASRRADGPGEGPHRSDFVVRHAAKGLPAALCSTGEQKALLIAILLANARLEQARRGMAPLLLLDEAGAHLDAERREALFDELSAIGAQAWLTGQERAPFAGLRGRAQFLALREGRIEFEE
jgi:DNA replication and repair protein RecF